MNKEQILALGLSATVLKDHNLTWRQLFSAYDLKINAYIATKARRFEKLGYVAVGFTVGMNDASVMLWDHPTLCGRFIEIS